MDAIRKIRQQIDLLDQQIALLLNSRMQEVELIGKVKKSEKTAIKDSGREAQVLDQVAELIQRPLFQECMGDIYQTIFDVSKKAQHFLEHDTLPFRHIGIIGFGLMGGSLCKALKTKDPHIQISSIAYASEDYKAAQEWIDKEYSCMQDLADAVDLIIIASPISTVLPIAKAITSSKKLLEKPLVLDLASVKMEITAAFETMTDENIEYISSHPMAGKEKRGFQNSQALLFVQQPWIIVPHTRNSADALQKIEELIRFVGAKPLRLDAAQHDRQAALISHIPGILSEAFFQFVQEIDSQSTLIAGPGFRSFTRLAHESPSLREEIIAHNHTIIRDYLEQWKEYLQ